MNESAKVRDRILSLLEGKTVLDLGCGTEKIVPWAVGVDSGIEHGGMLFGDVLVADIAPPGRWSTADGTLRECLFWRAKGELEYDVVFSSHALEHMRQPVLCVLEHWLMFVKPGGRLILYLPDERRYVFDAENPRRRNPAHRHYLTADTFRWYLDQIPSLEVERYEHDPVEVDLYSFLVVARRREGLIL